MGVMDFIREYVEQTEMRVPILTSDIYEYVRLRVPNARRSKQSILKEISPRCSFERMMPKMKLQYFDHLMQRVDSFEKTLMLGGIGAGGEGDHKG